jgi:hypothetical protein
MSGVTGQCACLSLFLAILSAPMNYSLHVVTFSEDDIEPYFL